MIHIFRKKPKFAVSYAVFVTTGKKAELVYSMDETFVNLKDAAAFLQYSFQIDTGAISYYTDDKSYHCINTEFYYGISYRIEFDDIKIVADVQRVTGSGRYAIKAHYDALNLITEIDRR
jgi:hypothetical protein